MGLSIDGFVATPDGIPSLVRAPDFVPGRSHGYPEFIEGSDAVVMGRQTFVPALGAPDWPWGDMKVFVLTSSPLPPETPAEVVVSQGGPEGLVDQLRSRGSDGDVHLVGGPRTIQAISEIGALDSLEVIVLPFILGSGVRLWPAGTPAPATSLLREPRVFADGSVELAYGITRVPSG
jgi:dihydrofolate reductase